MIEGFPRRLNFNHDFDEFFFCHLEWIHTLNSEGVCRLFLMDVLSIYDYN